MRLEIRRLVSALGFTVMAALASTSTQVSAASNNIWSGPVTPLGPDSDASAVELGVRFRSDISGFITGIRFYKFAGNTGTHIGNLWSNTGALLARATFTTETASGWQVVTFATPVAIAANTVYVASYHTDVGRYAANASYFISGFDNAPLHALADGVGGANGVYRYSTTTAFPTDTWNATNYWVDVVFSTTAPPAADTTPPIVQSVTPAILATSVSPSTVVTATFSEMMSSTTVNSSTFELRDAAGNIVPATVMAGGETPTATLTPTSGLASSAGYIATVKGGANGVKDLAGNALAGNFSWSFSTIGEAPPPPPPVSPVVCPCSVWSGATAVGPMDGDTGPVELGFRFRSDVNGFITGIRFYKHAANTGTHIGSLWTATGTRLTSAFFTGESASGWQEVTFATPVTITANTTYVASYHTDTGHYAASGGYFTSGFDNAPLHALKDGVDGPSGIYRYGASAFPTDTYQSANYWVDVVFRTTLNAGGTTTPLTVSSVTPAAGATGVSTTSLVTAGITGFLDYASVNSSTFELRDSAGNLVPASVGGGGETQTFTLTPASPLAYQTTYTATVKGGTTGIKDRSGNGMTTSYTWSFTTAAAPSAPPPVQCPCTIWNGASTTAAGPEADASPVELGVRFRSDIDGFITGVRFYKHSTNTGTHLGNLWTNAGALLASATFINESATGWQQVVFSVPVAIKANTTYVASYHTNAGRYAANAGYFAAGFDSVPLHALADGVDGPNGVYRYGSTSAFPTDTWHSANYWVDVVFAPVVSGPNDMVPPLVAMTSPVNAAVGVANTTWVTATFSEAMDPATISGSAFTLQSAFGTYVPATVTYAAPTGTAILKPNAPLADGTTYTAVVVGGATGPRVADVAGNAMTAVYSWSFTTAGTPPPLPPPPPSASACPCSLWNPSTIPAVIDTDSTAVEVGMRFRSDMSGYITALRFYKGLTNTGIHVGNLWSNTGALLARATFTSESIGGWQQMNLTSPVSIAANTTYVVSYHTDTGHYAANGGYFSAPFDNPPLHGMRDGADGPSGVYIYGSATRFPTETWNSANYWIDVVFDTAPPVDASAPRVNSVTPAPGSTGVSITNSIGVVFTEMMAFSSLNTTTFVLRDPAGNIVPVSVFVGGETPTVTLVPQSPLANSTTYTVTVKGTVTDVQGSPMGTDYVWSFTTAGP